jgi:hypothetical protein
VGKPEKVEAFRLRPPNTKAEDTLIYSQWPILAGPVTVDSKIGAELSAALLDEKTYCLWDEGKGCHLQPGLMVRFFRESRSVDVVFCFECDMMLTFQESKAVWGANFDYSHNLLLGFFVKIFPSDPDLPRFIRHNK